MNRLKLKRIVIPLCLSILSYFTTMPLLANSSNCTAQNWTSYQWYSFNEQVAYQGRHYTSLRSHVSYPWTAPERSSYFWFDEGECETWKLPESYTSSFPGEVTGAPGVSFSGNDGKDYASFSTPIPGGVTYTDAVIVTGKVNRLPRIATTKAVVVGGCRRQL